MAGPGRALVTGAAAGLGLAICRRLAADGWQIVAVDRDRNGLDRLGERLFCDETRSHARCQDDGLCRSSLTHAQ